DSGKRFDHAYYASKHCPWSWSGSRGPACFAMKSTRVWQVAVQNPRHRSWPPVICTSMPPPISRRGSPPTARRSWATFPTTQTSHHRFRLVRSSLAELVTDKLLARADEVIE